MSWGPPAASYAQVPQRRSRGGCVLAVVLGVFVVPPVLLLWGAAFVLLPIGLNSCRIRQQQYAAEGATSGQRAGCRRRAAP